MNTSPTAYQPLALRTISRALGASAASALVAAMTWAALPRASAQTVQISTPPQVVAPAAWTTHQREAYEPLVPQGASSSPGQFNAGMMFLADQLDRILLADLRRRATVVASIVSLDELSQTSPLGRLVAEHLMHELQLRSWAVTEMRLAQAVSVQDAGEFSLTREAKALREAPAPANIVTGTYASTAEGVLLSVRIVDAASGHVLASAQTRLLRDRFIAALVDKPRPLVAPVLSTVQLGAQCPSPHGCPAPR